MITKQGCATLKSVDDRWLEGLQIHFIITGELLRTPEIDILYSALHLIACFLGLRCEQPGIGIAHHYRATESLQACDDLSWLRPGCSDIAQAYDVFDSFCLDCSQDRF